MRKSFTPLALLYALLLTLPALAQEPLRFRLTQDIPVTIAGAQLSDPWSGGLNTPQFSTIDLNQDGQDDLFIFDRQLSKVYTWLAVQEEGQWRYSYAPEYEQLFPEGLTNWVLLRDYNCDGLKDIFASAPLGIQVFKQELVNGLPAFTLVTDGLRYNSRNINMQMKGTDIPAITDIDGDGDLDVLLVEFAQGYVMELYRNVQAELGQACGSLEYVRQTDWWGNITECEGCNVFKFGEEACPENAGGSTQGAMSPLHSGHDGSSLLLLDLDGDGDKELVTGGVQCESLVMMENRGTTGNAVMTDFNPLFPADKPANFSIYPAAYYEDVTFDGVPDLLVASQAYRDIWNTDFERSIWLYENKGQENMPDFGFVKADFLQNQMLEVSEWAYPAFADLDGDGDLDMLIGNYASFKNNFYSASLSFYRNTGTASAPAYTLVTDDYLSLKGRQLFNLKPTFADMNGDGATDLVLTFKNLQGGTTRISYLQNLATTGEEARFDLAYLQDLLQVEDGDTPAFADLDGDGDPDMLLGKAASNLAFYRNTGSAKAPVYTLESESFGGINYNFSRRYLHPALYDIDGNGDLDLLTVDESGELRIYRNITENMGAVLSPESELLEQTLTQEVTTTRFGNGLSIAVAPLGAEGQAYAVIGTRAGGLYLLQQTSGNTAKPSDNNLGLTVYPNPYGQGSPEKPLQVRAQEAVQLDLYDMVGRRIYQGQQFSRLHTLQLPQLQSGVYILRAKSQSGAHASRKLMLR